MESNQEQQWISVSDKRKPKKEQMVLCYVPECHIIGSNLIGQYFKAANGYKATWTVYDFHESKMNAPVEFWMPLPSPPNPDKK